MAFTDTEAASIRAYLGYGQVFRQYDPRLENAILTVGNLPESLALAQTIMASIATVDAALPGVLLAAGTLEAVNDVKFAATGRSTGTGTTFIEGIRAEGRRYIGRLSTLFAVPVASDYFGEDGYAGDDYMGRGNQQGRLIPLG
jgi:hypothetical protein